MKQVTDETIAGDTTPDQEDSGPPSKTQRKRDALALQKLAARLSGLSARQLRKLPLPETVVAALETVKEMKRGGARKRQLQYIARLLRASEPVAIADAMPGSEAQKIREQADSLRVERLLGELRDSGDTGVQILVERYPGLERQQLRQLLRTLHRDKENDQADSRALAKIRSYLAKHTGD